MNIPIPCKFGERADCNNKQLPLIGVDWFNWSWGGWEYTYFFSVSDKWHTVDFYNTFEKKQPFEFVIPDNLLSDTSIKDRGYPLKGRGFAGGIRYQNGKTYMDFIITSNYFEHIRVECDQNGMYVPNGDIIFPTGWDTEEKKERAVLKKIIKGESLKIKEPQPKQLSIFDFI